MVGSNLGKSFVGHEAGEEEEEKEEGLRINRPGGEAACFPKPLTSFCVSMDPSGQASDTIPGDEEEFIGRFETRARSKGSVWACAVYDSDVIRVEVVFDIFVSFSFSRFSVRIDLELNFLLDVV